MGRWRPPRPKSSAYITQEGAEKLTQELQHLWKVERPKITDTVHEAAKNGDRSENGDYIYGKKRLREIDARVRYLAKRLDDLTIVDRIPNDQSKIYFGAWVTLEDELGEHNRYRIVGPDEFNVTDNKISMDSPLSKAVLGKSVDDEITFDSPEGQQIFVIVDISYTEK